MCYSSQVTLTQFHELKEEVLLLKESLLKEKQKRYQIQQQLGYETERSAILSHQIEDLNQRLQVCTGTWKSDHLEEVNQVLGQVTLERQQRVRAETELKMEAAKLEDFYYNLEKWRNEDKEERSKLQDEFRKQESDCKYQLELQRKEVEELKNDITKCSEHLDGFQEFLASENVMISGLWREQLQEINDIKEKIDSINKVSEEKSKEFAQVKQWVKEFDDAIVKRTRSSNITNIGKLINNNL